MRRAETLTYVRVPLSTHDSTAGRSANGARKALCAAMAYGPGGANTRSGGENARYGTSSERVSTGTSRAAPQRARGQPEDGLNRAAWWSLSLEPRARDDRRVGRIGLVRGSVQWPWLSGEAPSERLRPWSRW